MRNCEVGPRCVPVALLCALALAFDAPAVSQQTPPTAADTVAADVQAMLREADPNLPAPACYKDEPRCKGFPMRWVYNTKGVIPSISMFSPKGLMYDQSIAYYLGWNDEGTWFVNGAAGKPQIGGDGHVYVWKLANNTLTQRYDSDHEIPQEVLLSLRNFSGNYLLKGKDKRRPQPGTALTPLPVGKHNLPDPNLPGTSNEEFAVTWAYYQVYLRGPPCRNDPGKYLGWNEAGSWIAGCNEGVYVWNIHKLRLAKYYETEGQIPPEILATLNQAN